MNNKKITVLSQLKKTLLVLCLGGAACAQAETNWLNIMGDPKDPTVNTIEVDPTPVSQTKDGRVMRVRVSRSAERISSRGIAYRSFEARVLFDCAHSTARYLLANLYLEPGWKGAPHHTTVYDGPPQPMEFRDVEPNPAQRILRAACQSSGVTRAIEPDTAVKTDRL